MPSRCPVPRVFYLDLTLRMSTLSSKQSYISIPHAVTFSQKFVTLHTLPAWSLLSIAIPASFVLKASGMVAVSYSHHLQENFNTLLRSLPFAIC